MANQTPVIYNPTTRQHEPLALADKIPVAALDTPPLRREVFYYPTSGTVTKPSWVTDNDEVCFRGWGAGAGGGSGARQPAGTISGGGGGGAPGGFTEVRFHAGRLGATTTVTVGAGGAGGAAITVDATAGNPGFPGGDTVLGTFIVTCQGGGAGLGGTSTAGGVGGAFRGGMLELPNIPNGGAGSNGSAAALGVANGTFAAGAPGGGGISAANVPSNGAVGSRALFFQGMQTAGIAGVTAGIRNGGAASTTVVDVPTMQMTVLGVSGGSGASGDAAAALTGGDGGASAGYAAGGAGGGASRNGIASGAGAAGRPGYAVVIFTEVL